MYPILAYDLSDDVQAIQHTRKSLPLLVLRVLAADNVDIFAALSPHTLAALAQLLDTAPHLHTTYLLLSDGLG